VKRNPALAGTLWNRFLAAGAASKRFLPTKLATLLFSSRNDKAPGCVGVDESGREVPTFIHPNKPLSHQNKKQAGRIREIILSLTAMRMGGKSNSQKNPRIFYNFFLNPFLSKTYPALIFWLFANVLWCFLSLF